MKTFGKVILSLALSAAATHAQTAANNTGAPVSTPPQITSLGANYNLWQWQTSAVLDNGRSVVQNHSYTEVASGLNYQDPTSGQWLPAKALIRPYAQGAVANQGQHQIIFADNLNTAGAIDEQTPDGKRLLSNIIGLLYYDPATGQSAQIAQVQDSEGQLVADNQVLFTNAFNGVNADVLLSYRLDGMEQDVVLRAQLPAPESFGLNPATVELEAVTAFLNPPAATVWNVGTDSQGLEADQAISWGATSLGHGRAFSLDGQDVSANVIKQYVQIDGQYYLLEKVRFQDIQQALSSLPEQASNAQGLPRIASKHLQMPKIPAGKQASRPMRVATATRPQKGYVLDYISLNSAYTNYVFQGDSTYFISSSLNLSGTNIYEGGAVIKYAAGATITGTAGSVMKFISTSYDPVMFSAKDDNGIGDGISGSTGSPSGYYANPALTLGSSGSVTLGEFRIAYANRGLSVSGCSPTIYDAQIVKCATAVSDINGAVSAANVMFSNVKTNFNATSSVNTISVQNATFNNCFDLVNGSLGSTSIALTNCAFVNVTNLAGSPAAGYNGFYQTPSVGSSTVTSAYNPLQTLGAGDCYLTNGCAFKNAGTTAVWPLTLDLLAARTTYPPIFYDDLQFTAPTNLSPQAPRDYVGNPDLGYHYDPMDYVFGGCDLSTNMTASAGTAIGYIEDNGHASFSGQPYGIAFNNGANLTLNGTATAPCMMPLFHMVQEGVNGNWGNYGYEGGFMINGSGSAPLPQINATFTKWTGLLGWGFMGDYYDYGVVTMNNCEVYNQSLSSYAHTYYFTNCLFFRSGSPMWGSANAPTLTFMNCTWYNGGLGLYRFAGQSASQWTIMNTTFDGTGIVTSDNLGGNATYTHFDYNAYDTNYNTSWITYNFGGGACIGTLETVGSHSVTASTGYGWESSWFGNFYLPAGSPLLQMGSTTADQLGLYHFTTQTNQVPETNAVVDIGYHYVATDAYGNPLDTNGDGIPDYLEDANGNGLVDSGEIGWNIFGDLGLQVIISRPKNGSSLP